MMRTGFTKSVCIPPANGPWSHQLELPGSKSLTNRALLIAALAEGKSRLLNALRCDDTRHMIRCLGQLGVLIQEDHGALEVFGSSGRFYPSGGQLYVGNAGTVARFLTAALNLGAGSYILAGNHRMHERPVADLVTALVERGCNITALKRSGSLPLQIRAGGIFGGYYQISGRYSSQFISSLMMAAPYANDPVTIGIDGTLVSAAYVEMTRRVMAAFGVDCRKGEAANITIQPGVYQGREFEIEGDASTASYFLAAAAITGGEVRLRGVSLDSWQGDLAFLQILEKMGCKVSLFENEICLVGNELRAIDVDMNNMSDVAPTLSIIALFADGSTRIRNVAHMRVKECDRIAAIASSLKQVGAEVEELDDGLIIQGKKRLRGAAFNPRDDHRMAMALSLIGLRVPGVSILNPACVSKTCPDFFELLSGGLPENQA